jgi:chitinase
LMSTLFSTALSNGVKPGLSVGGWGYGSSRYSPMVASHKYRSSFIESLKTLVNQYGITGVDIDWEYPGRESDENVPYDAKHDLPNYLLLLQELRHEFGNNLTISAALGVAPYSEDVSEIAEYFDWAGLMFYDFGQDIGSQTASNSPLNGSDSAVVSVELWSSAGLPKEKMIFGVPSYGRNYTMVDVHPICFQNLYVAQFSLDGWYDKSY